MSEGHDGLRGNPYGHGRMNAYVCEKCGAETWTVHSDDPPGVTPFMLRCRATPGCLGWARSRMYPAMIPDPAPRAHCEWFRPADPAALELALRQHPEEFRAEIRRHFDMGGSLLRDLRVN